MASDKDIRRVIEEIDKMRKQIRNSKLTIKRRIRNLQRTFDLLERGRIELEIEMLKGKIRRWEIAESKLSASLLKGILNTFEEKSGYGIDWSKAEKA